ncbi:docking domain of Afi1 for Arf3 in vesicle trafficking-domain-containing protein [Phakopsora pachyrhizi]|nr:docking domain of Afi1 for Arf3 in vesicle trafficking-domain-containing protein [Phakopsora pachyrhizi]
MQPSSTTTSTTASSSSSSSSSSTTTTTTATVNRNNKLLPLNEPKPPPSPPPPPPPPGPHAAYILLAEFDIDTGSGLRHQYPSPTGTTEHVLAELMLPDGAHDRNEDWTVFFLNQTPRLRVNTPRPSTENWEKTTTVTPTNPSRVLESKQELLSRTASEESSERLLYVINLVRTKKDTTVRRGAVCKAMAVCSFHPYIQIFKPILLLALEDYFVNPSIDCLSKLFHAINSMDTSGIPALSYHERLILRSSERQDIFEEKFGFSTAAHEAALLYLGHNRSSSSSIGSPSPGGSPGLAGPFKSQNRNSGAPLRIETYLSQTPSLQSSFCSATYPTSGLSHRRPRDTHFYDTKIEYSGKSIPVRIPLQTFHEEVGEYSLIQLIQTFSSSNCVNNNGQLHPHLYSNGPLTHPIIVLFNALVTHKRIIFLGHGLPAGIVSQMVLAACALGSGCGGIFEGFTKRAFPYSNLTIFEDLKAVPAYIAGVTNPIFELHTESWDVFCNIGTGKISISKDIPPPSSPARTFFPAPPERSATELSVGSGIVLGGLSSVTKAIALSEDVPKPAAGSVLSGSAAKSETVKDCYDNVFMEDILQAIQAHFGESIIRARFLDYVNRFAKISSRWEEDQLGVSSIGVKTKSFMLPKSYSSTQTIDGKIEMLGSGAVFFDEQTYKKEMSLNSSRIEGWMETESYKLFRKRFSSGGFSKFKFDISHQISRLRISRKLPDLELQTMYEVIVQKAQTNEEVTEVLAHLPPYLGGLLPLTFGLFHPSEKIRILALELVRKLESHQTGQKFFQSLNSFHKLAYQRQAHYHFFINNSNGFGSLNHYNSKNNDYEYLED